MRPETDVTRATQLRPGVAAVIRDGEGRTLLRRRSDNGRWGLPGGSVENGESVRGASVRAVREETRLAVEVARLVGIHSDPRVQIVPHAAANVVHCIRTLYAFRSRGGNRQTGDEAPEPQVFAPDRLLEDLLPMRRIRIQDAMANRPAAFIR